MQLAFDSCPALSLHINLTLEAACPFDFAAHFSLPLQAVGRLSSLVGLAVGASYPMPVRNESAKEIAGMTALERLAVDLDMFDGDLSSWSALTRLSCLSLESVHGFRSTACAALLHLPSMLPRLEDLSLKSGVPGISTADQVALFKGAAAATGLTRLALLAKGCGLTDASVGVLSNLRSLADLSLYRQQLTGEFMAGVALVAPLTRLALLKASGSRCYAQGCAYFARRGARLPGGRNLAVPHCIELFNALEWGREGGLPMRTSMVRMILRQGVLDIENGRPMSRLQVDSGLSGSGGV